MVTFAPRGRILVWGAPAGVIYLWDVPSRKEVAKLEVDDNSWVDGIAFSPDGKVMACANRYGRSWLWDMETRRLIRSLGEFQQVHYVALTPNGKRLADADVAKEKIRLWDCVKGRELCYFPGCVGAMVFSPDGRILAFTGDLDSYGPLVRRWDVEKREALPPIVAKTDIDSLCYSPDGHFLATAGHANTIEIRDAITGRLLRELNKTPQKRIRDFVGRALVLFSPDGKVVAGRDAEGHCLCWWEVATGAEIHCLDNTPAQQKSPTSKEREVLWAKLATLDATSAYAAIHRFVSDPENTVGFLRRRMQPISPLPARRLDPLIAQLDDDDFEVRQRASAELERLGDLALPALDAVLARETSAEVRHRAKALRDRLPGQEWPSEQLRVLRAIQVLEYIGTREARQVLQVVAEGAETARLTQEARASLRRLTVLAKE